MAAGVFLCFDHMMSNSHRVVAASPRTPKYRHRKRQATGQMIPITLNEDRDEDDNNGTGVGTITRTAPKTKRPSLYKVLLLNDDYTPQEFVVWLLEAVFHKGREEATQIMLHVHNSGVGVCGVYTYEVAETKVAQVLELARRNEHPLQCTMERE